MPESCKQSVRFGEDYALYVTNLPLELNEDGISKIFKKYGTVKAIIAPTEGQFAFISYGTYAEAEDAIRSLDGKPPLDLKVQFRRTKTEKAFTRLEELQTTELRTDFSPPIPSLMKQDHVLSGPCSHHPLHDSPIGLLRNKFPPQEYDIAPAHSVPPNFLHYPYDRIEYPETNALWSRGSLTVNAAGRRHVTMGRGYTLYNISEPRPGIINDIARIYEIRHSGCYQYGSDQCKNDYGECLRCSRDTTLCCSVCEGFYCSRACQAADWSKHQEQCGKIPPLVGANSHQPVHCSEGVTATLLVNPQPVGAGEVGKQTSQSTYEIQEVEEKQQKDVPLRLPKIVMEPSATNTVTGKTPQAPVPTVTSQVKQSLLPDVEEISKPAVENVDTVPSEPLKVTNGVRDSHTDIITRSNADNFLPSAKFTDVLITSVKEAGVLFFVQKVEDNERIAELMQKLNESIQQCPPVDEPVIGKIYGVIYDRIWHRGLVMSFNPTVVDYIDWGTNEAVPSGSGFRDIGALAEPPRFSQLIRLPEKFSNKSKDLEIDSVISVKKISLDIDDGVCVINVERFEEKKPVATVPVPATPPDAPTAQRLSSVLSSITAGTKLVAEIVHVNSSSVRAVVTFDAVHAIFESLLTPFKDDCDGRASSYPSYVPKVDELVAIKKPHDEYWARGYVLKYQPPSIEIASLDEATIVTFVEKIIPLSPKYRDICVFSIIMNAHSGQSLLTIRQGSVVELDVTAINSTAAGAVLEVDMKNDQGIVTTGLQLNEWTPWEVESPEVDTPSTKTVGTKIDATGQGKVQNSSSNAKKIVQQMTLKNNTRVIIQSYRSPSLMFLRSVEPEEVERHDRLMQEVAKCALTSPALESLPQSADYVLAKFEDDNYYRAMVISSDPETKQVKIVYSDYGNIQITSLDKLRAMPEYLMSEVCCVKKVKLQGIKTSPPTEEAVLRLANAVANEEEFVYEPQSSLRNEDLVILTSPATGKTLNDQINLLLTPTWEREGKNEGCQSSTAQSPASSVMEAPVVPEKQENIVLQPVSTECFMLEHMATGTLGKNGETVSALFLETIQPGCKFVFAREDTEMIVHVTSVMPEMMKQYCESSSHYIPRNNELCIALFEDGQWYRGCCIDPNSTASSALVFFLDFGNLSEVRHTDMREMTRDFLKPEAFGCICTILDFIDKSTGEVSQQVLARLEALLLQNETYRVEIAGFDGDEYQIKLPEIQSQLVEEGLLS
ncbi:uncharacterized protein LOC135170650 [Diachasmimorpha longicaudata]|uniref:uncharacterized protein LOC135170650 n=1 Tax=Diachasmimorpha longicaudata TaxID=58733 RepID=UPI0030B86F8D